MWERFFKNWFNYRCKKSKKLEQVLKSLNKENVGTPPFKVKRRVEKKNHCFDSFLKRHLKPQSNIIQV